MCGEPFLAGLRERVPRNARGTIPVGFVGLHERIPHNVRKTLCRSDDNAVLMSKRYVLRFRKKASVRD